MYKIYCIELLGPVSRILPRKATKHTANSMIMERSRMAKYPTKRDHRSRTQRILLSYLTTRRMTPKIIVLKLEKIILYY